MELKLNYQKRPNRLKGGGRLQGIIAEMYVGNSNGRFRSPKEILERPDIKCSISNISLVQIRF